MDQHFVRRAVAEGVDYRDRAELTAAELSRSGARLTGNRDGKRFELRADFLIDASGPGGFVARALRIPSGLSRTATRAGLVFSHFTKARLVNEVVPGMPSGPYPDDWAAVHHIIDEVWMYSLRFDHGVTSAGFALTPRGAARLRAGSTPPGALWRALLRRYPTIGALFADAAPTQPIAWRARIQHRLTRAAGPRWAMLPHAYAFVDPLFSTGIAWTLRCIERLGLCFDRAGRLPSAGDLTRYDRQLAAEADQIDRMVSGAYEAMAHFDLFAAHALVYFAAVSYAETRQRLVDGDGPTAAWSGFLGVGDPVLHMLPRESRRRLRRITRGVSRAGTRSERDAYRQWVGDAIASRNVCGFAAPERHNLYPVDLDTLVDRHDLLGLSRAAVDSDGIRQSLPFSATRPARSCRDATRDPRPGGSRPRGARSPRW